MVVVWWWWGAAVLAQQSNAVPVTAVTAIIDVLVLKPGASIVLLESCWLAARVPSVVGARECVIVIAYFV